MLLTGGYRSARPIVLVTGIRRVPLRARHKMTSTGPFASTSTSSSSSSASFSSKPRSFPPPSRGRGPASFSQSRGNNSNSDDAWKSALTRYAKSPDPASLPAEEVLHWDEQTITIYDGYEKAKHHFLCLPRIPFRLKAWDGGGKVGSLGKGREEETPPLRVTPPPMPQKGGADSGNWRSRGAPSAPSPPASTDPPKPTLSAAGGKLAFGISSKNATGSGVETVPPSHLGSLSDLLRSPYAGEVLAALEKAAYKTAEIVKERMPSTLLDASAEPSSTATANCTWDVHIGFHAVPSMDTVHLHVISSG